MRQGATYLGDGRVEFRVWAPFLKSLSVRMIGPDGGYGGSHALSQDERGHWTVTAYAAGPSGQYLYLLDERLERADPASNCQPGGIIGPSQIVDHGSFKWEDSSWRGLKPSEMIIYELHTGAFTPEGTFDAIVPRLDELKDLGVNAIELMPIAQFPGERNWGYDGVFPYAPQNTYGGPEGLRRLVNECHKKGLAVILDVVYNHLGPEGNCLRDFGPYFTDTHKTPWGEAVNFDGPYSDFVRDFFIENALHWFRNYRIDALRLDAVHAIFDLSPRHFLKELKERVADFSKAEGRAFYLMAESDLNDPRLINTLEEHGYGMDAAWCEDFHHALHALITGERTGYYADFGTAKDLVKSLQEGFVYTGQYSAFRKRSFGAPANGVIPASRFIVFSQNHDQVGNRAGGERLTLLASFEALKLTAGFVMLSPYIPLIFMGEEYAATTPFLYFISHDDKKLIEATKKGRAEDLKRLGAPSAPPPPESMETFLASKIRWEERNTGAHGTLLGFYKALINLRRAHSSLAFPERNMETVEIEDGVVCIRRWRENCQVFSAFNFSRDLKTVSFTLPPGRWTKALDSSEELWDGPGSELPRRAGKGVNANIPALSFAVYIKEGD